MYVERIVLRGLDAGLLRSLALKYLGAFEIRVYCDMKRRWSAASVGEWQSVRIKESLLN